MSSVKWLFPISVRLLFLWELIDIKCEQIPKALSGIYCELVGANPGNRPNPADVITRGRKTGGFFKNELVDTLLFLEEIQIKERSEKNRFFSALTPYLDNFPQHICQHKILPQLITAFEYGDAGAAVLVPMFKVSSFNSQQKTTSSFQFVFKMGDYVSTSLYFLSTQCTNTWFK